MKSSLVIRLLKEGIYRVIERKSNTIFHCDDAAATILNLYMQNKENKDKTISAYAAKWNISSQKANFHVSSVIEYYKKMLLNKEIKISNNLKTPFMIHLAITLNCNLKCPFCAVNANRSKSDELPLNFWRDIIDQAADCGMVDALFSGGEPTIYASQKRKLNRPTEEFYKLINYASKKGFYVTINTNGTTLCEDISTKKLRECGDYIAVSVSVDGATSQTHDSIRGEGSFRKAMKTIELLTKYNFYVKMNTVVIEQNFSEIPVLYQLSKKLNVNEYNISPTIRSGRAFKYKNSISLKDVIKLGFDLGLWDSLDMFPPCARGEFLAVGPKGEVFHCPCGCGESSPFILGNARNQKLEDILNSQHYQKFIEEGRKNPICTYLPEAAKISCLDESLR